MPRLMHVRRWPRGSHDRLYFQTPEGIDLGWYDLRTQRCDIKVPGMWPDIAYTITWWRNRPKGSQAAATTAAAPGPDLATARPGTALRRRADELRPGLAVRVLARLAGRRTADHSWTVGERGEQTVAAQLDKLTRHGWKVLHSIATGAGDIDHLLIGPSGVYVINSKHHPGARVDVHADTIIVNGRSRPYPAHATTEATLARSALHRALGYPVHVGAILAIHGHDSLTGWRKHAPRGVRVLPSGSIRRWAMLPGRAIHNPADIAKIYDAACDPSTWQPAAPAAAPPRIAQETASPLPVYSVSAVAPRWSTAGLVDDGRPWMHLLEFPAGPADPRTDRWRDLILAGDLGDLLSARQVADELGLPFEEFRQLVIDSEFYWYRHREGRPAIPPPSAPDHVGEPEWFRYALAEHFGAPHTPRELIRNIYDELE